MQNIEIALSAAVDLARAERVIDQTLAEMSLEIALRGTLKKFPGCIHWHAKTSGRTDTLEITLWPQRHRVWLTIQSGRRATWITNQLPEIQTAFPGNGQHCAKPGTSRLSLTGVQMLCAT